MRASTLAGRGEPRQGGGPYARSQTSHRHRRQPARLAGPQRQIRLLVSNPTGARRALAKAGFRSRLENVVVVSLGDRPGTLGRTARKLARAGVNINYAYGTVTRGGKRAAIVFGVGNPGRAARLAR